MHASMLGLATYNLKRSARALRTEAAYCSDSKKTEELLRESRSFEERAASAEAEMKR